jgi:hypothetical protein
MGRLTISQLKAIIVKKDEEIKIWKEKAQSFCCHRNVKCLESSDEIIVICYDCYMVQKTPRNQDI